MFGFAAGEMLTSQFILMFLAVFTGLIIGKIRFKQFKLGISGTLFTGILIGWYVYQQISTRESTGELPEYARAVLERGVIDEGFFHLFLILFVASVGLLAAKDMGIVVKKYGAKFAVLGVIITLTGALVCYLSVFILRGADPYAVAGVYTGALTSSPGLGAAIESVSRAGPAAQEAVAAGHAMAYPFGVVIVIFAVHLLPKIFNIDVTREAEKYKQELAATGGKKANPGPQTAPFDLTSFLVTCILGYVIGKFEIKFGPLGYISLGSTGGILITALTLGYLGKLGPFNFRMDEKILTALRQISLAFFLAVVGLKFGYAAVNTVISGGILLVAVTFFSGGLAVIAGFLLGRFVFKINWILLAGAICGGMTSTPGLGAAIDSTQSDDVASGYGATYPVALFFMVLFTILLHKMPLPV